MRSFTPGRLFAIALLLAVAGCGTFRSPDRRVERATAHAVKGETEISTNALTDARQSRAKAFGYEGTLRMDQDTVLHLATKHAPNLQTKREQLYLNALSLAKKRRGYGLQFSGTLQYALGLAGPSDGHENGQLDLDVRRSLPFGGDINLTAGTTYDAVHATGTNSEAYSTHSSAVGLLLNQPLLAGAGYDASHEDLIQAEHSLVYALRAFALERQDFAIGILSQYYQVLNQKTIVENIRLNVQQSEFLRKRSEALFKVRRAAFIDVLRSRQQELSAHNQLNVGETEYETQVKRFLLALGLPVETPVEMTGRIPELRTTALDEARCIDLALRRRLDLLTARNEREDAVRRLRLARNGLLPDLSVYGKADWRGEPEDKFSEQDLKEDASAGVKLSLPLDRRDERDAVKSAEIALDSATRDLEQTESSVRIEIMESFRRLNSLAATVQIEQQNVDIATQRARNAVLRFRNGELSNRDVVEAENELLDARNAYAQALIDYELQRIRLLRNVGLLDVAPDGALLELAASDAGAADEGKDNTPR